MRWHHEELLLLPMLVSSLTAAAVAILATLKGRGGDKDR